MDVCVLLFSFGRETFSILNRSQRGKASYDEFLVIFKRDHSLLYMCVFAIVLMLGTALHCST